MKVIIAGGRDIDDFNLVKEAVKESGFEITEVVSGKAPGADKLGERWAEESGIPVKEFPADWELHGKSAGPIRNVQMAKCTGSEGALILVWNGQSRGSANMLKNAKAYGLKIFQKIVKE